MVIRDKLNTIQLLLALAAILMLCAGCGTDEESIVEPDTPVEPDISTEKPAPDYCNRQPKRNS